MSNKSNKYVCGICGKEYDTVSERNECETKCLKDRKLKEKQKADNISINNLFNNYFNTLDELESLVASINAELENYYNQYNMVYANYSVVKKLSDIWLYDKTIDSKIMPGTIYNESSVYATPKSIEKFSEYIKTISQDKTDRELSELEIRLMQKVAKEAFQNIDKSIDKINKSKSSNTDYDIGDSCIYSGKSYECSATYTNNNTDKKDDVFRVRIKRHKMK